MTYITLLAHLFQINCRSDAKKLYDLIFDVNQTVYLVARPVYQGMKVVYIISYRLSACSVSAYGDEVIICI